MALASPRALAAFVKESRGPQGARGAPDGRGGGPGADAAPRAQPAGAHAGGGAAFCRGSRCRDERQRPCAQAAGNGRHQPGRVGALVVHSASRQGPFACLDRPLGGGGRPRGWGRGAGIALVRERGGARRPPRRRLPRRRPRNRGARGNNGSRGERRAGHPASSAPAARSPPSRRSARSPRARWGRPPNPPGPAGRGERASGTGRPVAPAVKPPRAAGVSEWKAQGL